MMRFLPISSSLENLSGLVILCAVMGKVANKELLRVAGAQDAVLAHLFLLGEPLRSGHWRTSASRSSRGTGSRPSLAASSLVPVWLALGERSSLLALASPCCWLSASRGCGWLGCCSRPSALLRHRRPGARLVGDRRRWRRFS